MRNVDAQAVRFYVDGREWLAAMAVVQDLLHKLNTQPATRENSTPALPMETQSANIADAIALCRQRYEVYRGYPGRHESYHRSDYRRSLLSLWATLDHYAANS